MILLLVLGCSGTLLAAGATRRTETELKQIRERIQRMNREQGAAAAQSAKLTASLRESELAAGRAREALARLVTEQTARSEQRTALARERAQIDGELVSERRALAEQLRVAYRVGNVEPLQLLLNQRQPLQSARMLTWYGYFGRARASQIDGIQQRIKRLDEIDTQLEAANARLDQLARERSTQIAEIETRRGARQKVLAGLQRESQSRGQVLARLQAQQAELEKLLRDLSRAAQRAPPPLGSGLFAQSLGKLDWPVAGRLVANFGSQRASGVRWQGVVVATERSADVHAVAAGRVIYADWLPGLGLLAIVDHGDGYMSLYGHNEALRKAVGDAVSAGEVIAAAGDTGGRSSPELYFEIRRAGQPVDPRQWFRKSTPPG
jgi:septal ring factor EnvC (AmiA/AmiB activator)